MFQPSCVTSTKAQPNKSTRPLPNVACHGVLHNAFLHSTSKPDSACTGQAMQGSILHCAMMGTGHRATKGKSKRWINSKWAMRDKITKASRDKARGLPEGYHECVNKGPSRWATMGETSERYGRKQVVFTGLSKCGTWGQASGVHGSSKWGTWGQTSGVHGVKQVGYMGLSKQGA